MRKIHLIVDREDFTLVLRLLARVGRDAALQGQQRILRFAKDDNFFGEVENANNCDCNDNATAGPSTAALTVGL